MKAAGLLWLVGLPGLLSLSGCGGPANRDDRGGAAAPAAPAGLVGSAACGACHAAESAAWAQSDHAGAMAVATEATVLGDFADVRFDYGEHSIEFLRRGETFVARTADVPRGMPAWTTEFPVRYTFGLTPLQQYLVDVGGGRLQALNIAWDSRPAAAGGQRWFDLYAGESLAPDDALHWGSDLHNWNSRCAACHSTGFTKGFSSAENTYHSQFADINVGCEACHGPASRHVDDPAEPVLLGTAGTGQWVMGTAAIAARSGGSPGTELAACAACHSRRAQFHESPPGTALLDAFEPVALREALYHPDGQILDEVFVYGSFVQSAMHNAGVTCSDCHEPHSGALRRSGDALCEGCHNPVAFSAAEHHRHPQPEQPACVDCHMPATTYMTVDPRRDHSFRVPRPDLSQLTGAPNACGSCHQDSADETLAAQIAAWFPAGRHRAAHYGAALAAAQQWQAGRLDGLLQVARDTALPGIVRATALELLARQPDTSAIDAAEALLQSTEPTLQLAAIRALTDAPAELRVRLLQRFLDAPLRATRLAAVAVLADVRALLGARRQADLDAALAEYRQGLELNADSAEGLQALGVLELDVGNLEAARAALTAALARQPDFAPALVNLAETVRAGGDDAEALRILQQAATTVPDDPGVHAGLGLALTRAGEREAALGALTEAVRLAPADPYYRYLQALALDAAGGRTAAEAALAAAQARFPGYAPITFALATMARDAGDADATRRWAESLLAISPGDAGALSLLQALRARE